MLGVSCSWNGKRIFGTDPTTECGMGNRVDSTRRHTCCGQSASADGDRLAMAARFVEQKHLIANPALETLATL